MISRDWAERTIPKATSQVDVLYSDGDTHDIIKAILFADAQSAKFTEKFSTRFKGLSNHQVAQELWNFIKENIKYKEDQFPNQYVKSPAQLFHDREGDCKSFSVFIVSVLKNLGIPSFYRFVTYKGHDKNGKEFLPNNVTHVYPVIIDGNKHIYVDAVYDKFNEQKKPYYRRKDIMAKIAYVHGHNVGCGCNGRVGDLNEVGNSPIVQNLFGAAVLLGIGLALKNFSPKRAKL